MTDVARKTAIKVLAALPLKAMVPWLLFAMVLYAIVMVLGGANGTDSDTAILDVALASVGAPPVVQAFVYISIGAMAKETMTDYSIATLRTLGAWKGDIYILTDNPSCFSSSIKTYDVKPVVVPRSMSKNIMEIKALKARVYEFLPIEVTSVMYLDVDIVVQKPVGHFLVNVGNSLKKLGGLFDLGAFPDAQGHYFGFCSGCEKWHTGVLFLRRYDGQSCLKEWGKLITSGEFDTDQESLDAAESRRMCEHMLTLAPSYLLFAKDYVAMALTSGHTFVHITAAGRLETQGYFYKNIVVPSLRGDSGVLDREVDKDKECNSGKHK